MANDLLDELRLPPSLGAEIRLQHPAVQGARMGLIQSTGAMGSTPWIEVLWTAPNDTLSWTERDAQRVEDWLRVRLGESNAEIRNIRLEVEGATG